MITRKGSNQFQTKKRLTVLESVLIIIVLTGVGSLALLKLEPPVISPLPDSVVFAEGPTPTPIIDPRWPNVIKLIVDEFEPEGPQVTYQAISVAKAESGWKSDAYNWNTNNTADQCVFQINDVHIKRFGTKFKTDLKECIRVAHVIYKRQGWKPWVAAKKLGLVK